MVYLLQIKLTITALEQQKYGGIMFQKFLISIASIIIVFGFMSQNITAQENDTSKIIFKPGLSSIQFGVTNDLDLDSFKGSYFSYKRFISNRAAINLRVSIQRNSSDLEATNLDVYPDTTYTNYYDTDAENNSTRIELSYVYYLSYTKQIKGFVGAGPFTARSYSKSDGTEYYHSSESFREDETKTRGFLITLGSEWFVKDYLSLTAEYGLSYSKTEATSTRSYKYSSREDIDTQERNSSNFGTTQAIFGLAFYF